MEAENTSTFDGPFLIIKNCGKDTCCLSEATNIEVNSIGNDAKRIRCFVHN